VIKKIIFSFGFSSLLFLNVLAHGFLSALPKEKLATVQKMLIKEGDLKVTPYFKYGVYDDATEIAYDRYQYKKNKELYDDEYATTSTSSNYIDSQQETTFFGWIWLNFKALFGY
jgi:hypothetical protein